MHNAHRVAVGTLHLCLCMDIGPTNMMITSQQGKGLARQIT